MSLIEFQRVAICLNDPGGPRPADPGRRTPVDPGLGYQDFEFPSSSLEFPWVSLSSLVHIVYTPMDKFYEVDLN